MPAGGNAVFFDRISRTSEVGWNVLCAFLGFYRNARMSRPAVSSGCTGSPTARQALALGVALILVGAPGCGGNDSDDELPEGSARYEVTLQLDARSTTRGGTLFTLVDENGATRLAAGLPSTWNTYCANQPNEVHLFVGAASSPLKWANLAKPDLRTRTAYAYSREGWLFLADLGNEWQFKAQLGAPEDRDDYWQVLLQQRTLSCGPFTAGPWEYHQATTGDLMACADDAPDDECDRIAIHPGTFPYAFAEAAGRVLVVTNWGDLLLHRPGSGWCRMEAQGAGYACPSEGAALGPTAPRGFQFYSSVRYGEHTLLGRWPGGALHRFDGETVVPHSDSPPLPADSITAQAEAQSMAVYCGRLFVGYWPRGDLWVHSAAGGGWQYQGRAFTHPSEPEPAIPYADQPMDGVDSSFLGQRITSLVPFGDSLVLTTSNLRGWHTGIGEPEFLSSSQVAEYGAVWKLHQPGCATAHFENSSKVTLQFDVTPQVIRIRQHGVTLVVAANPGVLPQEGDRVLVGAGIFGSIAGEVQVQRLR